MTEVLVPEGGTLTCLHLQVAKGRLVLLPGKGPCCDRCSVGLAGHWQL
jgi:hypothetical protein